MKRATAQQVARLAEVDVRPVRRYADCGYIESNRNVNGWRIFPDPEGAARRI